ncbi:MAG: hypothetical protein CM1200mP2_13980 [Planctomycetaceae bacterium]|nr:MAG: hypothetical protein CM1200mP2_13980 [Planctomycetaceae bacterium]
MQQWAASGANDRPNHGKIHHDSFAVPKTVTGCFLAMWLRPTGHRRRCPGSEETPFPEWSPTFLSPMSRTEKAVRTVPYGLRVKDPAMADFVPTSSGLANASKDVQAQGGFASPT